jgi:hypothetical protein
MLPGLGLGGRSGDGKLPIATQFLTVGSGNVVVPAGYTSARVSCWGSGGTASSYVDGDRYNGGGGGGAFSQSVLAVTAGEVLAYVVGAGGSTLKTSLSRGATVLVSADYGRSPPYGGYDLGGRDINGVGAIRYSGAASSSGTNAVGNGGGAAGSLGSASANFNTAGTAAGPSATFTQSSNGATATAGAQTQNYGGGGRAQANGTLNAPGSGIIVIEWGVTS